ncbi:restriction endonuclease subunit S [Gordonia aquimaris]|uniref:Restriction endonuclease subunit S n=1 Tax=Gordonia aquimaris TaxID=2984863 RepID=A0A9X3D7L5_9ACTN|nr:restriction endonuclease subunit S [Gordonia aquimaris]MCX2966212.1 restriction endonuclease subunit S [Gordonia aquimaris]
MTLNLDKSAWQRIAFGDVIENVTTRVEDPSKAGVDKYVGLEHLDPGVMTVQRWDTPDKVEAQKLRFQPGDVIFGRRRAYQKKVALAEFEGICSAHALVLRARPACIDPTFLPVFLSSDYFLDRAIAISVGSLSPTVNWRDLKIQEFNFPPLDEQKRIADLLWAIERHRHATREEDVELASLATDTFESAAAGNELTQLATWVERIDAGRSPRAAAEPAADGELGVLKVSAVGRDVFVPEENKRLLNAADFRTGDIVHAGDVLVTRANAVVDNVARPCMVDRDFPNLMLSDKTLRLVPTQGYPGRVLLAALRSPAYRAYVREVVNGTEAKNISQAKILAGPVPVLQTTEVERVAKTLASLDATSTYLRSEIDTLVALKRSILAEVFGGN